MERKRVYINLVDRGLGVILLALSAPHLVGARHQIFSSWLAAINNLSGPAILIFYILFSRSVEKLRLSPIAIVGIALSVGASYFSVTPLAFHAKTTYYVFTGATVFYLVLAIFGYISLGRSFGIIPALRKVVTRGPFRWVRHPIYAAYLHTAFCFCLFYPCPLNFGLFIPYLIGMEMRAREEELLLSEASDYKSLLLVVKHRFFSPLLSLPLIALLALVLLEQLPISHEWLR